MKGVVKSEDKAGDNDKKTGQKSGLKGTRRRKSFL